MLKITKYSSICGANLVEQYREMKIEYPKFFKMDTLCKLGYLACYDLLGGAKFTERNEQIALVMCCSSSSIGSDVEFQKTISDKDACFASPSIFVYTLPNIVLGEIAIAFDVRGENSCFVARNADQADFVTKVDQLFAHTPTTSVICCWIDSYEDQNYALMMLVEKADSGVEFNSENIIKLYNDGKSNQ